MANTNTLKGPVYIPDTTVDLYQFADKASPHIASFQEKIRHKIYQFTNCACAICNGTQYTPIATSVEGFAWGICTGCGLFQNHIRLRDEDITSFYVSGEYQAICMGNLDDHKHFALEHKIMSLYFMEVFDLMGLKPSETKVFEIGCGSGGILLGLKEWGAKAVQGYDVDEYRVNFGKQFISEIGVADALTMDPALINGFNVILLSNILEHLQNPQQFISRVASRIESTDIKMVIDIPDLEYCYKYSDVSFLKFLHIAHLWYFNSLTLERLLNNAGLAIDYIFPRGAAFSIVCSKRSTPITNTNNAYWNSVSSINYANYLNAPNSVRSEIDRRLKLL